MGKYFIPKEKQTLVFWMIVLIEKEEKCLSHNTINIFDLQPRPPVFPMKRATVNQKDRVMNTRQLFSSFKILSQFFRGS